MTTEFYKKDGADWCRLTIDDKTVFDTTTQNALEIVTGLGLLFLGLFLLALSAHTKLKPTNT